VRHSPRAPATPARPRAPQVAGRLWELVVRRAELRAHLEALKDYYLLARGDFWDSFLGDAARLLAAPPNAVTADVDIRQPFQSAGSKTSAAGDALFGAFTARWFPEPQRVRGARCWPAPLPLPLPAPLGPGPSGAAARAPPAHPPASWPCHRLPTPPGPLLTLLQLDLNKHKAEAPAFEPGWDNISLAVEVQWPLGLLLTPHALDRYNLLFQYLLRLKRVAARLQRAWQVLQRWVQQRQQPGRAATCLCWLPGACGCCAPAGCCIGPLAPGRWVLT
jgi:gamma-tubulin complex component 4